MVELVIDRQKVKDAFAKYTSNYDMNDEKIRLKVEHTYRVAGLCDRIARALKLSDYDIDLAWLIGMLHDIGRFEQLRNYGTFSDAESINHAHCAVDILFCDGKIEDYIENLTPDYKLSCCVEALQKANYGVKEFSTEVITSEKKAVFSDTDIILKAVWNHSAYRVEKGLDERTQLFCDIIRDADKLDIFKVIYDTPIESIYDVSTDELRNSEVTDEVMDAFREKHAILRSLKKTPVDNIVGHTALAFELVFKVSIDIAKEQGYLEKIMSFRSENEKTKKRFREVRKIMHEYMK